LEMFKKTGRGWKVVEKKRRIIESLLYLSKSDQCKDLVVFRN